MNVSGVGNNSPIQKIVSQPVMREVPIDPAKQHPALDKLELSGMSHLLSAAKSDSSMRADKIAEIKAAIEAGTYETGDKLDVACDRLLDDLEK